MRKRAKKITLDPSHPAHSLFELMPPGLHYRAMCTKTARHKNSFFPPGHIPPEQHITHLSTGHPYTTQQIFFCILANMLNILSGHFYFFCIFLLLLLFRIYCRFTLILCFITLTFCIFALCLYFLYRKLLTPRQIPFVCVCVCVCVCVNTHGNKALLILIKILLLSTHLAISEESLVKLVIMMSS